MSGQIELRLNEWSEAHPDECEKLRGLTLPSELRPMLDALARAGRMTVLELARGVQISTTSWIGRLRLGDLTLTVAPKIDGMPLTVLLRYTYGLRDLKLHEHALHASIAGGLQDLLVLQLVREARELIARGLHRDYEMQFGDLSMPRGRIAFARLAVTYGRARAVLPCDHHPRTLANSLNLALHGALALGARIAGNPDLRFDAWRLAQLLADDLPKLDLTPGRLEAAEAQMDRRSTAYGPALRLARLLLEGAGLALENGEPSLPLPGFLFDMNIFFQSLLAKFLDEHLQGVRVVEERPLRDIYSWDGERNPRGWIAPKPRPDILIMEGKRVKAVLDAKYRDLWIRRLPREMLYQLTLYALGHKGFTREATIIYPSTTGILPDQAVSLRDPWLGNATATVVLRACDLVAMSNALYDQHDRHSVVRADIANRLAFGPQSMSAASAG